MYDNHSDHSLAVAMGSDGLFRPIFFNKASVMNACMHFLRCTCDITITFWLLFPLLLCYT